MKAYKDKAGSWYIQYRYKTLEGEERTQNAFLLQLGSRNRFQLLSRERLKAQVAYVIFHERSYETWSKNGVLCVLS